MRSASWEHSIDAARQLHRDVCMMTSNLNILDQYVLCLLGQHDFPSAVVASAAPIPRVQCASVQMEAMAPFPRSGGLPVILSSAGRQHRLDW